MNINKAIGGLLCVAGLSAAACSDDDDPSGPGGTASGGGGGAAGGGGSGAEGGQGGQGGRGGSEGCLDSASHEGVFTLALASLCVVEKHVAPFEVGYALAPKWGRHGGPVTLLQSGSDEVTIQRWAVPAGAESALALDSSAGPVSLAIPMQTTGAFLSAVVVDLPLSSWSLVGWTGDNAVGEVVALDGATIADRWPNVGYYDGVAIDDGDTARLLHTSQSELDDGSSATAAAGLYAADFCAGPALCNDGARTIATWGLATGPVAADADGNIFAVNTDYIAGDQELRGFHAAAVVPGELGEEGSELFTMEGYGSALAAIGPTASAPGIALYQPIEGVDAQPLIAQEYTADGGAVTASGVAATAITMANAEAVTLMNDAAGRIWLGVPTAMGETTFFVLDRP